MKITDAQLVAASRANFESWYTPTNYSPYGISWDTLEFSVKWGWMVSTYKALKAAQP